jgi:hypothetical protein
VNLVPRGIATDAASAALAATAALRTLEAAGVAAPAVWVAHGTARFDATAAWDHGIALVRVDGPAAERAALDVVRFVGARVVRAATDLGNVGGPRGDGAWLAARYELGLWPDERVDVLLGADRHPAALATRLETFDEELAADPGVPRRLVLAALTTNRPPLSEPMIRAILHPLTLVEVTRSDQALLDLVDVAAGPLPSEATSPR